MWKKQLKSEGNGEKFFSHIAQAKTKQNIKIMDSNGEFVCSKMYISFSNW